MEKLRFRFPLDFGALKESIPYQCDTFTCCLENVHFLSSDFFGGKQNVNLLKCFSKALTLNFTFGSFGIHSRFAIQSRGGKKLCFSFICISAPSYGGFYITDMEGKMEWDIQKQHKSIMPPRDSVLI